MARQGFLADNQRRCYPFLGPQPVLLGALTLPTSALVDFRCTLGLDARWREGVDVVYLARVHRLGGNPELPNGAPSGGTFRFTFAATAPGLDGLSLIFEHPADDLDEFAAVRAEATADATGAQAGATCQDPLVWSGTLTVGRFADLRAALAVDAEALGTPEAAAVEPALVRDLARTYVRSVNLANRPRTLAAPAPGCGAAPDPGITVFAATCLAGDLALKPGHNVDLRQNDRDNTITIAARVGAGAGEPCGEVPRYPGEAPPEGSRLLSGGPRCDELISSINGVSAPVLRLVPGPGFAVYPSPDAPHTLVVAAVLEELLACPPLVDSSH